MTLRLVHCHNRHLPTSARHSSCGLRVLLAALLLLAAVAIPTHTGAIELPPELDYPKIGLLTAAVGEMSEASLDTIARFDLVVFTESTWIVPRIRERNPNIRILYHWMPQTLLSRGEGQTFWYPDTTWSLHRLSQFYAEKNDWYLRDIYGQKIPEWDGWAANWTRYCPRGVYGTSHGLNYVEWLVQVAIPQIVENSPAWGEPWGLGSSAYDGFLFETLVDCVGSWGWQTYQYADPDQDGIPDGVYATCTMGGADHPLSVLYREMNDVFYPAFRDCLDNNVLIVMNTHNKYMGPRYLAEATGQKLEGWMSWYNPSWQTWWNWFYEQRNYNGTDTWGSGYLWAENNMGHTGIDEIDGWDSSFLQVWPRQGVPDSTAMRLKRWGLGTALLGDGYFMYTRDQTSLYWQPEYEWNFGRPIGDFFKRIYNHTDTVYVRMFTNGMVEVNPNERSVDGIPTRDSRFSFGPPAGASVGQAEERAMPALALPRPYHAGSAIRLEVPFAGSVRVTLHDFQGRHVKTLYAGHSAAGRLEIQWDGQTASGRKAAAGWYHLSAELPRAKIESRLLLIKK